MQYSIEAKRDYTLQSSRIFKFGGRLLVAAGLGLLTYYTAEGMTQDEAVFSSVIIMAGVGEMAVGKMEGDRADRMTHEINSGQQG